MGKTVKVKDVAPGILQQYTFASSYMAVRQDGVLSENTFANDFIRSRFDKFHGRKSVAELEKEDRRHRNLKLTALFAALALSIAALIMAFTWALPKLDALMDGTEEIAAMTDQQARDEALSAHLNTMYTVGIIGMSVLTLIFGFIGFRGYYLGHMNADEPRIKKSNRMIKVCFACLMLLMLAIIIKTVFI